MRKRSHFGIAAYYYPNQKYLDIEQHSWKKIHQKRLDVGLSDGWYLYYILFPQGSLYKADYVTVNRFDSFSKLVDLYPEDILYKAYSKKDFDK